MGKKLVIPNADFSSEGFLENKDVTQLAGNIIVGTRWTPTYNETRTAAWSASFGIPIDLSEYVGIYSKVQMKTKNGYYFGPAILPNNGNIAGSNNSQQITWDLESGFDVFKINMKSEGNNSPQTDFVPQSSLAPENYIEILLVV